MSEGVDTALSTQHAALVPEWCEWGRGESPILLVAPHGGRRPAVDASAPPPGLRVNDLHTPEVTRILADGLRAGFVINRGEDRNALDLNRLSQVRRRAPWFLELLVEQIAYTLQRHARAEVIFVHGWNTGQVKCDIGIGTTAADGSLGALDHARVTVSDSYLRTRIAALQAACVQRELAAPIGEKYPASHPNNLVQLFTTRHLQAGDPVTRSIAEWVAAGRLDALQLELSIPLRWPGVWRDRFIEAVTQAFGTEPLSPADNQGQHSAPSTQDSALRTQHIVSALQFYDPKANVGMFAGVARVGPRSMAGRLLLFLGGQRIALFTGEEVNARGHGVPPLEFAASSNGTSRLRFAGPMMLLDDAAAYVDLEAALAGSRLIEADVDLGFEPFGADTAGQEARFGKIEGRVTIDTHEVRVAAGGFANAGALRAFGSRQQTMLAVDFGNRGVLSRAVHGEGSSVALDFRPDTLRALNGVRIAVATDGDAYTPTALELRAEGCPPLHGQPLSRMGILRPTGHGGYLRVTFGVARFQWDGAVGHGLYEYARPVGAAG